MNDPLISRVKNVLDFYEKAIRTSDEISYRDSSALAKATVRTLLTELAVYVEHNRLGFDPLTFLAAAKSKQHIAPGNDPGRQLQVNEAVVAARPQRDRPALPRTRGYVSGIDSASGGDPEYTVVFPGVPARHFRFDRSELQPASPFPEVETSRGVVTDAAEAERAFIDATARLRAAERSGTSPEPGDFSDQTLLAGELGHWAGVPAQRIEPTLSIQIEQAMRQNAAASGTPTPAQLASRDFPQELSDGLTTTQPAERLPERPAVSPRRPNPGL